MIVRICMSKNTFVIYTSPPTITFQRFHHFFILYMYENVVLVVVKTTRLALKFKF